MAGLAVLSSIAGNVGVGCQTNSETGRVAEMAVFLALVSYAHETERKMLIFTQPRIATQTNSFIGLL